MKRITSVIIVGALVILVGGALFLASWDIPAPSAQIERPIPNDRFTR
jgi:hypothetical protein